MSMWQWATIGSTIAQACARIGGGNRDLCVPKTSSGDDFGFDQENSLFLNQNSLFRRNNSLFCCVGNFAGSL